MKLKDIVAICNSAMPKKVSWMWPEPYGSCGGRSNLSIGRIAFCVTPSPTIVSWCLANDIDLLISHHPYPQRGIPHLVYHTALDCCEGGINDIWRDHLGMFNNTHVDRHLGWFGSINPISLSELATKVGELSGDIIGDVYGNRDKIINTIAVVSGLGGIVTHILDKYNPDCYITGELTCHPGDSVVIEVGHTLSERCGILLFQKLFANTDVEIISVPLEMDVFGREVHNGQWAGSTP